MPVNSNSKPSATWNNYIIYVLLSYSKNKIDYENFICLYSGDIFFWGNVTSQSWIGCWWLRTKHSGPGGLTQSNVVSKENVLITYKQTSGRRVKQEVKCTRGLRPYRMLSMISYLDMGVAKAMHTSEYWSTHLRK
jgi:hypothetical protein